MEILTKMLADCKVAYAAAEARFKQIQSPALRMAVLAFVALVILMVVWAILPWIGFIVALIVIALLVRAFLPKADE